MVVVEPIEALELLLPMTWIIRGVYIQYYLSCVERQLLYHLLRKYAPHPDKVSSAYPVLKT